MAADLPEDMTRLIASYIAPKKQTLEERFNKCLDTLKQFIMNDIIKEVDVPFVTIYQMTKDSIKFGYSNEHKTEENCLYVCISSTAEQIEETLEEFFHYDVRLLRMFNDYANERDMSNINYGVNYGVDYYLVIRKLFTLSATDTLQDENGEIKEEWITLHYDLYDKYVI